MAGPLPGGLAFRGRCTREAGHWRERGEVPPHSCDPLGTERHPFHSENTKLNGEKKKKRNKDCSALLAAGPLVTFVRQEGIDRFIRSGETAQPASRVRLESAGPAPAPGRGQRGSFRHLMHRTPPHLPLLRAFASVLLRK